MVLDDNGRKAFLEAAESNNFTAVRLYIEDDDESIFIVNDSQETLAHIAARNCNLDMIKYVLKREPSIAADKDMFGSSAVFQANSHGATDIVRYLIEEHGKAIIGENGPNFFSAAMHTAVQYGHLNTLKYFIEDKGKNVDALNKRRESLLFAAIDYHQHPIVKYLVEEKEADITLINNNRNNILFPTIANDDLTLLKYFLDERQAPFDINWHDRFGNTLVHRASFMNRTEIMEYLVDEKHANINLHGFEKMTPLHYAASRNHHYLCKFLIEHGANPRSQDEEGRIPIERAFDKTLIAYIQNATNTTRSNTTRSRRSLRSTRSMSPISIHENNRPQQQQILEDTELHLPISRLDGSATTLFTGFHLSRVQIFIVIANMFIGSTWRWFGWDKSDIMSLSPVSMVREKMDPIAIEAVRSMSFVEE